MKTFREENHKHVTKLKRPSVGRESRWAKLILLVFSLFIGSGNLKRRTLDIQILTCYNSSLIKCPFTTAWHHSALAHTLNQKLTISKSQTKLKKAQQGDFISLYSLCSLLIFFPKTLHVIFYKLYTVSTYMFSLLGRGVPLSGIIIRTSCFPKEDKVTAVTGSHHE